MTIAREFEYTAGWGGGTFVRRVLEKMVLR
jgi:hypothetical protein